MKYGRLTIINEIDRRNGNRCVLCRCECGKEKAVLLKNLRQGNVKSCGCLKRDSRNQTHGLSRLKGKKTRLYRIWGGMKTRCFNVRDHAYLRYGGRGISICDEWLDYATFHSWALTHGYSEHLSIDRIDNDGNYEPGNCRWVNRKVQANNRRHPSRSPRNRILVLHGESKTLAEWSRTVGINYSALSRRLKRGWSTEKALTTPLKEAVNG